MPADGSSELSSPQPPENKLSKLFHTRMSRRDVVVAGAASALSLAVSSSVMLPKFVEQDARLKASRVDADNARMLTKDAQVKSARLQQELDQKKIDADRLQVASDRTKIEVARSEEERKRILEEQYRMYIKDYSQNVAASNNLVIRYVEYQEQKNKQSNYIDENALKIAFERTWLILERGVSLAASWDKVEGRNSQTGFDKDGRLMLEGRRLHVNESVIDYHIALNILYAKLIAKVGEDNVERSYAEEDLKDFLRFADIRPQITVEKTAWAVMPNHWARALARFSVFLDEKNIPPPQEYRITRSYQRDGARSWGGFYRTGAGKLPQESQVIHLGSTNWGEHVFHEGGHYIADAHKIGGRLFGADRRLPYPNFQREYDSMLGRMQKSLLQVAKKAGRDLGRWEENCFVSPYASTNTEEDFAETFKYFINSGPAFRQRIKDLRKVDPTAASMLEAKYEFMKMNVAKGFEYSFDGRNKNAPPPHNEKQLFKDINSEDSTLESSLKKTEGWMKDLSGKENFFREASANLVSPRADADLCLALLEPIVWSDLTGLEEIVDVSNIASVVHKEFEGKVALSVKMKGGETKAMRLDTKNAQDIANLAAMVAQLEEKLVTRMTVVDPKVYSPDSLGYFKSQAVSPPRLAYSGVWSPTYPPYHVDREALYFVRFQYSNGEWKQKTIDLKRTNLFIQSSSGARPEVRSSNYYTVSVGDKDMMLGVDSDGVVREVRIQGFEG